MRTLMRCAVLAMAAAFSVVLLAGPAEAHAELVRSDPADGVTLNRTPRAALLWFSEEVVEDYSSAQLLDERGATVPGTNAGVGSADPTLLQVTLPRVGAGTYSVVWRVLAADDGHTTSGVIVFTVDPTASTVAIAAASEPTGDTAGAPATPAGVLLRWLGLCMLAAVVGGLAVAGPVLGGGQAAAASEVVTVRVRQAQRRILTVVAGCAALAACFGAASLIRESHAAAAVAGRPFLRTVTDLLTATHWGQRWLASEVALLALAALVLATRRRVGRPRSRPGTAHTAGMVILMLAIVWVRALGSHAGSLESARVSAVAADALHILTALLWLGALPALVLAFWPRVPGPGGPELIRACRGPLTGWLVISATVLVATGLYGSGRQVGEPSELLSTSYGRALLVKSALLAVLAGLGLVNSALLYDRLPARLGRFVQMPARGSASRRLILVEAAVGAALLVAAGLLAETAPPRAEPVSSAAAETAASSGAVADLVVSVAVTPSRPGTNVFTVLVASSRRPPPAPIDGVTLELPGAGGVSAALGQIEPGRYPGTAPLSDAGPTEITIVVHRSGRPLTVAVPWQVSSASEPPAPARQLAPYVNAMALCLLALALVVRVLALSRRRPRSADVALPRSAEMILEEVR